MRNYILAFKLGVLATLFFFTWILLLLALIINSCNQPSKTPDSDNTTEVKMAHPREKGKVTHSDNKIEIEAPGQVKKEYPLTEYYPISEDQVVFTSDDTTKKKIKSNQKYYKFEDDTTLISVWKNGNKKGGVVSIDKQKKWDIVDDELIEGYDVAWECSAEEPQGLPQELPLNVQPPTKCVTGYYEVDYDSYVFFGSDIQAVTDHVNGKWAVIKLLFNRDSILIDLTEIGIRTSPDPYTGTSSYAQLMLFKTNHLPFTADIQMLHGKDPGGLGGIASSIGTICNSLYTYAYSDVSLSYNLYPTYSWDVMVLVHEWGHILGMYHTMSCHWPQTYAELNGKVLDNCYQPEGSCLAGDPPIGGGFLGSYCHLTGYGISFPKGFGIYTRREIWNAINNAICVDQCGGEPGYVCTDTHENNDTTITATLIQNKIWYKGCFGTQQDQDFYRATTTTEKPKLSISIDSVTVNSYVSIYKRINATTNTLVKSQNIPANSGVTVITHTEAVKNVYYIKVEPLAAISTQTWDYRIMKKNLVQ